MNKHKQSSKEIIMKTILISLTIVCCFVGSIFALWGTSKKINIGDAAPSFSLLDDTGTPRSLEEFLGKDVVLYFYPKDATPGCTKEACSLRDAFDIFKKHDIVVIGVSYDSVKSHKKFKEKYNLPFILLSDRKGKVAHKYGTDRHFLGYFYPLRRTFLIDKHGVIKDIIKDVTPVSHAEEILKILYPAE